jgi:hypothetical protein
MKYFYIREAVYTNLRNLFYSDTRSSEYGAISVYINKTLFDNDRELDTYKEPLVDTKTSSIYNAIMFGITTSIDDVCLRIHLIPNIMELKRDIVETFSIDKKVYNVDYFWTLANANIKSYITQIIFSNDFFTYIKTCINNIISSLDIYRGAQFNKIEQDAKRNREEHRAKYRIDEEF